MKNVFFFITSLVFIASSAIAQNGSSFGIKGGLNYNANGNYFQSISNTYQNPDRNIGYHIGIFGKLGNSLYVRPELVYTSTKSDYDAGVFDLKKLDLPVLVGIKVLGPVSVFGGPAFQYILNSGFENASVNNIESDFSIGLNFGIGVNFNKFGIDLRYERGFSNNEATIITNNITALNPNRLDTRPEQLILSLSVKI